MTRGLRTGFLCSMVVLVATLAVQPIAAQPPPGYYNSAEGLTGQPLRAALHQIIDNHSPLTYDALWTAFQSTDAKPGNKVWDMYSDVPGGTPPYVYTLSADQCGGYNSEGDCYNREHSFPQSWFNGGNPMRTDLFHIYPTDGWVNNKRGNLPFGNVGSPDWTSLNGSMVGLCVDPGYNGTVFEPIDAYKGDFARSYFYMMTRYLGEMGGWSSPMLANGDLALWAIPVMIAWSDMDPVSPKETARNNAVFARQDNRNPYIDRPEWVHAIWGTILGIPSQTAPPLRIRYDGSSIVVERGEALPGTLTVRDMAGRIILTRAVPSGTSTFSFGATAGAYLVDVVSPEGRFVQRFVR